MELKSYQQRAISDLAKYLRYLDETQNISDAYKLLWEEQGVHVGIFGLESYQNLIPGVPNVCFKVPTGGGKTFMAAASIKVVFDAMPAKQHKAVVWLVPSDSILEQTLKNLKNPDHPYRRRIDADFGGRVEVYDKAELLSGQNFNPTSVAEQLSIMVLSYDSFRSNKKEGRKAYQENSNLATFSSLEGTQGFSIEGADDTALFQVINMLNPYVIVDESHHARSNLSIQMLTDFNPSFILDLTATPREDSNLISITDAFQLKRENMVKLPIIVYNRNAQEDVITDAIDLRGTLEAQAIQAEKEQGSPYIRPIVLFQAQPKGSADSTTFDKLKEKLVKAGIPEEQIAIKTADKNELKGVDLLSRECPIRYIITINALKEGWDCPFAYVLASLANKTSKVDVEQILGRVLRQPYARRHNVPCLNMAYVLASSNDFQATVDSVVTGLNDAGFSKDDYRVGSMTSPEPITPAPSAGLPTQMSIPEQPEDDMPEFDPERVKSQIGGRKIPLAPISNASNDDPNFANIPIVSATAAAMIGQAQKEQDEYDKMMKENEETPSNLPAEIASQCHKSHMLKDFEESAKELQIPQFMVEAPPSLFREDEKTPLTPNALCDGFSLANAPAKIDFDGADEDIYRVDLTDSGDVPKAFRIRQEEQKMYTALLSNASKERRLQMAKDIIHNQINRIDQVDSGELSTYLYHVIDFMDDSHLAQMEKTPYEFGLKIKSHVNKLLESHKRETFDKWIRTDRVTCEPRYQLPSYTNISDGINLIPKALYEIEAPMNTFERDVIERAATLENVVWWHRIIERKGFCINGFINHYPDFMIYTSRGKLVLVETKGAQLANPDSEEKIELGRHWTSATSNQFQYYMVFEDDTKMLDGAYGKTEFLSLLRDL